MARLPLVVLILALAGAPAAAQPVEVTPLAAPDAFSTPGRDTGLRGDLWRGTSIETLRAVLPMLAQRPLSPAAAALARRVLATGAPGPRGVADDPDVAGGRISALIALGDLAAANRIVQRSPGLERSPEMSRAAAEAALLAGDNPRACAIADNLATGREAAYWLRLRAFCQALAGANDQAQLTFDLAQAQAKDAIYARLMSAKLSGLSPGAPSLRNGLDYALSKNLDLDLSAAKPAPAVAAALSGEAPGEPTFDVAALDDAVGGIASALAAGPPPPQAVSALIAAAADSDAKSRARLEAAALLAAALLPELAPDDRARLADFPAGGGGRAPAGRYLALDDASQRRLTGDTALFALWISADTGIQGLALGDRVRIVRALSRAGLSADARAFALEGLAGLK